MVNYPYEAKITIGDIISQRGRQKFICQKRSQDNGKKINQKKKKKKTF